MSEPYKIGDRVDNVRTRHGNYGEAVIYSVWPEDRIYGVRFPGGATLTVPEAGLTPARDQQGT